MGRLRKKEFRGNFYALLRNTGTKKEVARAREESLGKGPGDGLKREDNKRGANVKSLWTDVCGRIFRQRDGGTKKGSTGLRGGQRAASSGVQRGGGERKRPENTKTSTPRCVEHGFTSGRQPPEEKRREFKGGRKEDQSIANPYKKLERGGGEVRIKRRRRLRLTQNYHRVSRKS